jgi:hypothetical protein
MKIKILSISVLGEQDKTAAIYATFGIQFKIENNVYLGSEIFRYDGIIDYRGKSLFFIKLARMFTTKQK